MKEYKLLLTGARGAGKTSFADKLRNIDRSLSSSVGTEISRFIPSTCKQIQLNIWDATDDGQYQTNVPIIADTDYAIIMVDHLSDYTNYIHHLSRKIMDVNGKHVPLLVVINKCDLFTSDINVCRMVDFLNRKRIKWCFVSAKTKRNLSVPIEHVITELTKKK